VDQSVGMWKPCAGRIFNRLVFCSFFFFFFGEGRGFFFFHPYFTFLLFVSVKVRRAFSDLWSGKEGNNLSLHSFLTVHSRLRAFGEEGFELERGVIRTCGPVGYVPCGRYLRNEKVP